MPTPADPSAHAPPAPRRIPHRIETARLVLRCYEPADAEALRVTVAANKEHLLTHMPWARDEPQTLDEKLELVLTFRSGYDAGTNHVMGIFDRATGELVGGTGLHPPRSGVGHEVGYWIAAAHEGKGFVTEAVAALLLVALRLGHPMVTIRMDPANDRSEAICRRLGLVREGHLRRSFRYRDDPPRDTIQYTLLPDELEVAPWLAETEASVRAFDALGRPVDLGPAVPPASPPDPGP